MLDNNKNIITKEKILQALASLNTAITVIDKSHLHEKHYGVPKNGLTHIKLTIQKTPLFANLSQIQIHQKIYSLLDELIKNGLHAIEIQIGEQS